MWRALFRQPHKMKSCSLHFSYSVSSMKLILKFNCSFVKMCYHSQLIMYMYQTYIFFKSHITILLFSSNNT